MTNPSPTVVRMLRQILAGVSGHGYEATIYLEYSDGTIEVQETKTIAISATNVRKRDKGASNWEERVTGAPGWFRCDSPFDKKIA
jgi:hypothetical protein